MRDDDERDFEDFVARSGNRLLRSAVMLVGEWAGAEDLLQGALERTYRHWRRVSAGEPEAYVRRALVNAAVSRFRRGSRMREVPLGPEPDAAPGVAARDHADQLALRDELMRALAALPVRQRAVLVLRYLDDLSEREVADTLGCSTGTVKSQASRGLARLRAAVDLDSVLPAPGRPQ